MKLPAVLTLVSMVLLSAGCGSKQSSTSGDATSSATGAREFDLTANDTMHYNVTTLEAKPGENLKVVLTNTGSSPIEVMGHNWVLLKAGSDPAAFSQAAATAKATDYIPLGLKDEILAKIDLLGPRKSGEVDFKSPTTPGDYPYLCTFPAHYQVGMHGVLTVK